MIVVADTTPLHYLILIEHTGILPTPLELHAHLLLMDERAGRKAARRRSLQVAGTLAVLEHAAEHELLDFSQALNRLQKTNYRISADILEFFRLRNPSKKQSR